MQVKSFLSPPADVCCFDLHLYYLFPFSHLLTHSEMSEICYLGEGDDNNTTVFKSPISHEVLSQEHIETCHFLTFPTPYTYLFKGVCMVGGEWTEDDRAHDSMSFMAEGGT